MARGKRSGMSRLWLRVYDDVFGCKESSAGSGTREQNSLDSAANRGLAVAWMIVKEDRVAGVEAEPFQQVLKNGLIRLAEANLARYHLPFKQLIERERANEMRVERSRHAGKAECAMAGRSKAANDLDGLSDRRKRS